MQTDNVRNEESRRVAVITGSSKGIGKAIAMEFAMEGYRTVLNARDEKELSEAVNDINKTIGGTEERVTYFAGDISEEKTCSSLIEHAIKMFGRIDVLVNNAGIGGAQKSVQELTSEEWDYVIDVNLKGAFLCTREVIKRMTQDGKTSRETHSIINISSVHESIPQPQSAHYAASKGGMEMLTKTVAVELADKGIRVNGIAPGAIATDMNKDILEDEQKKKEEEKRIPMHRIGQPEEIAKVAVFVASDVASYMTGTTVYVDGGLTLSS
ncbi:MAG TPA: glucose 1-dehydrogenase [Nitrososphaeraceae archaeon]|nr:glucose 1-dehydrogenase [Nitrososphaeraceae archaeon]